MTPWGNAIAYETEAVRQYITEAPLFWLTEYQLDGLRFDAIDQIEDRSARHVLIEIAEHIRAAIPDRHIHLTTEDSRNVIFLHPRDENGQTPLFTAEWNDDFHNAAHVFATGETHAYYQDFAHQPAKNVARALAEGLSIRVSFLRKPENHAAWPAPLSRRSFLSTLFRITIRPGTVRRGEADFPCRRRENARSARGIASVAPHSFAVYGRRVCGDEPLSVLYRLSWRPREGGAGRAG
jgi:glycosidase